MKGQRDQLIEEVKKFNNLYNTNSDNYKDSQLRERCWREISKRLNANSEMLKREWKILRDSYRQVIRKKEKMNTKGKEYCKKWRFETQMSFLKPYMTGRDNSGNYKPVAMEMVEDTPEDQSDTMEPTDVEYLLPEADQDLKTDFWDTSHDQDFKDETLKDQVDPMELFFSSVCQTAKKLPKKLQNKIKREVLDIVLKVEEEYEEQKNTN